MADHKVRQVVVPSAARALSTLSHIDYEDAFLVEIGPAQDRTGEQWARTILEAAPTFMRRRLTWGWFALGLKLREPHADRSVLGCEVRHSTQEFALLGAGSRVGMPAELLFKPQRHTLLFATFVQQQNPLVRAVWRGVEPLHRQVVTYLLNRAARYRQAS